MLVHIINNEEDNIEKEFENIKDARHYLLTLVDQGKAASFYSENF